MTQDNSIQFDLNKALEDFKAGKPMNGKDGFSHPVNQAAHRGGSTSRTGGAPGPERGAQPQERYAITNWCRIKHTSVRRTSRVGLTWVDQGWLPSDTNLFKTLFVSVTCL